jgi:hypothetical protein
MSKASWPTVRDLAALVVASGLYGFSIGSVHSLRFALRNLVKFPLLILATMVVCGIGYFLVACITGARLRFGEVQRLALRLFRNTVVLLVALAPVSYFLARVIDKPNLTGLGEYPLFLGLNVCFIALAGVLALAHEVRHFPREDSWPRRSRVLTLTGWLALSLLVGGQAAWYLRPFFGVASIAGEQTPFFLGASPDYRGSTNFYEAVYHLVAPPPLAPDYYTRGIGRD